MSPPVEPDRLVRVYKALGDRTRLRLVKLLADLEPGDALCVNALAAELGVSQPAVSQHLSVLRAADLVIGERRGYHVHYRLNPAALAAYRHQAYVLLGEQFMASPAGARPPPGCAPKTPACRLEHVHDDTGATFPRPGHRRPS
jgi:DNA-binding transcriptional ArsR family regulator